MRTVILCGLLCVLVIPARAEDSSTGVLQAKIAELEGRIVELEESSFSVDPESMDFHGIVPKGSESYERITNYGVGKDTFEKTGIVTDRAYPFRMNGIYLEGYQPVRLMPTGNRMYFHVGRLMFNDRGEALFKKRQNE